MLLKCGKDLLVSVALASRIRLLSLKSGLTRLQSAWNQACPAFLTSRCDSGSGPCCARPGGDAFI